MIRLKFVNGFRDRFGRVRYYFRQRGAKAVPLPGLPGSIDFMAAYGMALVAYYKSTEWNGFADDTRHNRKHIYERFRAAHGDKRVALLRRDHIEDMLARIATPSARREWFKAIRALLRFAVPTMLKVDPTAGITVKVPKTRGHHSWTDDEIAQYRAHWALGTQQRLVLEFALETLSRRGEVVRLGPQHVRNGWIHIQRTHGSDDVDIEVSPELQAACDAMPKAHLTYIVSSRGAPRSKDGLGRDFAKWATEAGLPTHCRLHGLKKGGMRRRVEAGFNTYELMADGHKTLAMVQRYTTGFDKKRLAASGAAKLRQWEREQKGDEDYTNSATHLHKPGEKAHEIKG
jgi:integrase